MDESPYMKTVVNPEKNLVSIFFNGNQDKVLVCGIVIFFFTMKWSTKLLFVEKIQGVRGRLFGRLTLLLNCEIKAIAMLHTS